MRILITGGAGFVGTHLCERYLNGGHEVICVDNFITSTKENTQAFLKHKRFTFLKQDVSSGLKFSGKLDKILHFASPASPPDYLDFPIETLRVGSFGTYNALELARTKKAIFVLASTSEVYGDPAVRPQTESYWGNVNPIGPRSVYDEAKRFAEAMTMCYHRKAGLRVRIARIFNTYGPRMRPQDGRVIPNFISQALKNKPLTVYGTGTQTRSYCYVTDLVDGIYRLAESNVTGPVNLGNPGEKSVWELAKLIIEMTGSRSKIVFKPLPVDDPQHRCPDITQAEAKLGWTPKVPLKQGLVSTIDYFKSCLR